MAWIRFRHPDRAAMAGCYYRPSFGLPMPASMTQRSLRLRTLLLLLIVVVAGSGCSTIKKLWSFEKDTDGTPVAELYQEGHEAIRQERWGTAAEVYQRLLAQYPYGDYTEQALMETAYAQYKAGKHDDAISTIDRFIRTYPTHRNIAYCAGCRTPRATPCSCRACSTWR
jgi:outer membrane protein assembly factor BamD